MEDLAVKIAKRRPMYGPDSFRGCTQSEWADRRDTRKAIPVMDALRLMGEGNLNIGAHRFAAVACVPFEMPHGVIVRDMNDKVPTRTWDLDSFISLDGEVLTGYELLADKAGEA